MRKSLRFLWNLAEAISKFLVTIAANSWAWLVWGWHVAVRQRYRRIRSVLHRPPPLPPAVTPFTVLYTVGASFDYLAIKTDEYRGLLFIEVVVDVSDAVLQLITVWQSQDAYRAISPTFFLRSGLSTAAATVSSQGLLGDTLKAKKPWWSRYLPRTWGWTVAAITFGFLALSWVRTIVDASGWLFGSPDVETVTASQPIDVLVGEPIKFTMGVRNVQKIGDCYFHFGELKEEPSGLLNLDKLAVTSYSAVPANGQVDVPISGKAATAGDCNVTLIGVATSGLLKRSRPILSTFPVRVWRPVKEGHRVIRIANPKYCEMEIDLLVGKRFALGMEAEATLEKTRGVKILGVRSPGTQKMESDHNWSTPGKEVARLVWRTGELEAFRTVQFVVFFGADGRDLTKDEWEPVVQNTQFAFEEAR
jgi:hypothetical protein